MKYNVYHVDTCLSDYFGGHHLPVVQVSVTNTTTYRYLKDSLLNWQTTEHLHHIDNEAYREAVNEMFSAIVGDMLDTVPSCFRYIEEVTEDNCYDIDSCYAYFIIETVGDDDE